MSIPELALIIIIMAAVANRINNLNIIVRGLMKRVDELSDKVAFMEMDKE